MTHAIAQFINAHPILGTLLLCIAICAIIDWIFLPQKLSKIGSELQKIRELLEERKL